MGLQRAEILYFSSLFTPSLSRHPPDIRLAEISDASYF